MRVIYCINLRVLVAMVTHSFLQWYETHIMLCSDMKNIPVLILKSQRHTFSQTNHFSQIIKFFVVSATSFGSEKSPLAQIKENSMQVRRVTNVA